MGFPFCLWPNCLLILRGPIHSCYKIFYVIIHESAATCPFKINFWRIPLLYLKRVKWEIYKWLCMLLLRYVTLHVNLWFVVDIDYTAFIKSDLLWLHVFWWMNLLLVVSNESFWVLRVVCRESLTWNVYSSAEKSESET